MNQDEEISTLKERIDNLKDRVSDLEKDIDDRDETIGDLEGQVEELEERVEDLQKVEPIIEMFDLYNNIWADDIKDSKLIEEIKKLKQEIKM